MLRYLGTSDWLIRAVLTSKSIVGRARKLSAIVAWAISVPCLIGFGLLRFCRHLESKGILKEQASRIERADLLLDSRPNPMKRRFDVRVIELSLRVDVRFDPACDRARRRRNMSRWARKRTHAPSNAIFIRSPHRRRAIAQSAPPDGSVVFQLMRRSGSSHHGLLQARRPAYQPTAIQTIMVRTKTQMMVAGTISQSGIINVASRAVISKSKPLGSTRIVKWLTSCN